MRNEDLHLFHLVETSDTNPTPEDPRVNGTALGPCYDFHHA